MAYVIEGLAVVLGMVLKLYMWVVIIAALLSFVNPDPYNPIVRILRSLTEPVFYRIRRRLPFLSAGGLDFTPMAVILVLVFLDYAVVGNLHYLALSLRNSL